MRVAQFAWHGRGEVRQRIAGDAEGEIAAAVDLDDALVPAVRFLDGLMHRQRVDEFVGDHDDRAGRHLFERVVPEDRNFEVAEPLLLGALAAPG